MTTNKENNPPLTCCHLNTTLQEIYYEQIQGRKRYPLGYYTTYYYLLKDLKKTNKFCSSCLNFTQQLFQLYLEMKSKHSNF